MKYLSVCSGIEAATVAWHPLGWQPFAFSEIEKFPSAVLAHHYPHVPNLGDMTRFKDWPDADIDVLVGGTPCQSFSVAGLRKGMADHRGNLALTYLAIADRYRPEWIVWENVPGVLSSSGGRDFGAFIGGLAELGYHAAWRVLDAQFVRVDGFARAVPQRRRRVFVVGHLGDWRRAAAVLFERESLLWNPAPRRQAGERVAPTISSRPTGGGGLGTDFDCDGGLIPSVDVARTLMAKHTRHDPELESYAIAHSLRAEGFDASEDGTGRGTPLVPVANTLKSNSGGGGFGSDPSETFIPIAFSAKDDGGDAEIGLAPTLRAGGHTGSHANAGVMPAIAIQERAVCENPDAGPDGVGVRDDGAAYTIEARTVPQAVAFDTYNQTVSKDPGGNAHLVPAVAFDMRGREGGAQFEGPHETANIRAASGGSSRSYVVGAGHASTQKADAGALLRRVREALGAEAFSEWGLGILDTLQPKEILRSILHGSELRPAAFSRSWVVNCALSRAQDRAERALQSLREAKRSGCASQGWESSKQLAEELGAYLSELSHPGAQAERFMHDLWSAAQGLGVLRQALSAVQEARRPSRREGQPAHTPWAVRRLIVEECEFLQGFPRGYTAIPKAADGPRYKALGNSMAVNCMRWLGQRIAIVAEAK